MRILSLMFLLCSTLSATAQTHYCIGGDLDHLSAAEVNSCHSKMLDVREAVKRRGAPSGWRFLVVCDESGWRDVASITGKDSSALRLAEFSTDTTEHVTFLRGSHMDTANAGQMLNASLHGVPGNHSTPGLDAVPSPIPNPERRVDVPTLLMADAREAAPRLQDETAAGQ